MNITEQEAKFILERLSEEELFLLRNVNKVQVKGFNFNSKKMKPAARAMLEKNLRTILQNSNDLNKKVEKYVDFLNSKGFLSKQWKNETTLKDLKVFLENKEFDKKKLKSEQNYILYNLYYLENESLRKEYLEYLNFKENFDDKGQKEKDTKLPMEHENSENEAENTIKFLREKIGHLAQENKEIKKAMSLINIENKEKQIELDNFNKNYRDLDKKNMKLKNDNEELSQQSAEFNSLKKTINDLKEVVRNDKFSLLDLKVYASEEMINYVNKKIDSEFIKINNIENADLIFFYDLDYSNLEKQNILENLKNKNQEVIILKRFQDVQNWLDQLGGLKWKFSNQKKQILDILEN